MAEDPETALDVLGDREWRGPVEGGSGRNVASEIDAVEGVMAHREAPDGGLRVDPEWLTGLLYDVDQVAVALAHTLTGDDVGHRELECLAGISPARHQQAGGLVVGAPLTEVDLPVELIAPLTREVEQAPPRAGYRVR